MSDHNPSTSQDVHDVLARLERVSSLFHDVNSMIPEDQDLITVRTDTPAGDALTMMQAHGYSQLPVTEGGRVVGIFSYRAFALGVKKLAGTKTDPTTLFVGDFLGVHKPAYASQTLAIEELLTRMHDQDAVLVSEDRLMAILTPMDVLGRVHGIASAFIAIQEIELSLRTLIRAAVPDEAGMARCVVNAQATTPTEPGAPKRPFPTQLKEMSFDQYVALLRAGNNWPVFGPIFVGTQANARAKLEGVRVVRNVVFHFRRKLVQEDSEVLSTARDWLLRCSLRLNAQPGAAR